MTNTMIRHDLQATRQIIQLFERSKAQSEEDLDLLPSIHAVIDARGLILKGNRWIVGLYEVDEEDLLNQPLSALFRPAQWTEFQSRLDSLKSREDAPLSFQLELVDRTGRPHSYSWSVRPMESQNPAHPLLYSVVGQDVTELKRATEESTRMQGEVELARTVQDILYPPATGSFGETRIAGYFKSASECGGDWWHYGMIGQRLFLWIGDVTGHGVGAALVTSAARSAVSLIEEDPDMTPARALVRLNRAIYQTTKGRLEMTAAVASIDLQTGECTFAHAAHPPLVLIPARKEPLTATDLVSLVSKSSFPLGGKQDFRCEEKTVQLSRGDRVFFYTDGLLDMPLVRGRRFSGPNLRGLLANTANSSSDAEGLVGGLSEQVQRIIQGAPLVDDITFFILKF